MTKESKDKVREALSDVRKNIFHNWTMGRKNAMDFILKQALAELDKPVWQDMESAPRDGTEILVKYDTIFYQGDLAQLDKVRCDVVEYADNYFRACDNTIIKPIAWTHIPKE